MEALMVARGQVKQLTTAEVIAMAESLIEEVEQELGETL